MIKVLDDSVSKFPNGSQFVTIEAEPGIVFKVHKYPHLDKLVAGDPFTDNVGESRKSLQKTDIADWKKAYAKGYALAAVCFKLGCVPRNLQAYPKKQTKVVNPNQLSLL